MVSYKALNTAEESIISNTCYTVRNVDTFERITIPQSTIPNICHTIRNIDTFEGATSPKNSFPNICYTIRNVDAFEEITVRVSIIGWLSVLYALNGRKVTVWILFRYEKVII